MSSRHGSALGWPLGGALLLMMPIAFVVGALTGHTPTWGSLQNPVVLLGSLGVAALGNLWSLVHAGVPKGKPPTLRIDIGANPLSIIVVAVSGLLGALLLAYAFVENFTRR
jgi:ribose/xylose/arabinose/galactoside ABC-type transport system permease subunit